MHSRIFVLSNKPKTDPDKELFDWQDPDLAISLRADYITPSELPYDIKWFEEVYGIKTKEGLLLHEEIQELKQSLRKEKERRVQKVRNLINQDDPDLWTVAYEAWNKKGFYFVIDGSIMNEMEFLEYLETTPLKKLWIVESYDYHF